MNFNSKQLDESLKMSSSFGGEEISLQNKLRDEVLMSLRQWNAGHFSSEVLSRTKQSEILTLTTFWAFVEILLSCVKCFINWPPHKCHSFQFLTLNCEIDLRNVAWNLFSDAEFLLINIPLCSRMHLINISRQVWITKRTQRSNNSAQIHNLENNTFTVGCIQLATRKIYSRNCWKCRKQ